jgi:hypothetical protein
MEMAGAVQKEKAWAAVVGVTDKVAVALEILLITTKTAFVTTLKTEQGVRNCAMEAAGEQARTINHL